MGLFWVSRREYTALLARVEALEKETDLGQLERMRHSVMVSLRALRRAQQAQDAREEGEEGSDSPRAPANAVEARRMALNQQILERRRGRVSNGTG